MSSLTFWWLSFLSAAFLLSRVPDPLEQWASVAYSVGILACQIIGSYRWLRAS
jgi:hypothetical protein